MIFLWLKKTFDMHKKVEIHASEESVRWLELSYSADRFQAFKIGKFDQNPNDCVFRSIRPGIPMTSGHSIRRIRPLSARRVEA